MPGTISATDRPLEDGARHHFCDASGEGDEFGYPRRTGSKGKGRPIRRMAIAAVLLTAGLTAATAQQPESRVEVRLVEVEARVTDAR